MPEQTPFESSVENVVTPVYRQHLVRANRIRAAVALVAICFTVAGISLLAVWLGRGKPNAPNMPPIGGVPTNDSAVITTAEHRGWRLLRSIPSVLIAVLCCVATRSLWLAARVGWRVPVFNNSDDAADDHFDDSEADHDANLHSGESGPSAPPSPTTAGRRIATAVGTEVRAAMGYPRWTDANMSIAVKRIHSILSAKHPDLRLKDRLSVLNKAIPIALTPSKYEIAVARARYSKTTAMRRHYVETVHLHNPTTLPDWLAALLGLYVESSKDF